MGGAEVKKRLYLAGPLFNSAEREQKLRIKEIVALRFDVYVPHVDGSLLPELLERGIDQESAKRQIFTNDIDAIKRSDLLLIVLNGRTIDEGAAFELGVGWSIGKPCFGYKDDFRQMTSIGDNPMIECALRKILRSDSELLRWAAEFDSETRE